MKTTIVWTIALALVMIGCGRESGGGSPAPPPLASPPVVVVDPSSTAIQVGHAADLAAEASQSDGTPIPGAVFTWFSTDDAVAKVSDGVVTGVSVGTAIITATLAGTNAFGTCTITVTSTPPPPPTITSPSYLPPGTTGAPYSYALGYSGGTGTAVWSVISGTLPGGITMSGSGVLSGTPTAEGEFTFTVQVSAGGVDTKELTLATGARFGG